MSIQEHLNKIRNAVYGHEVRESIAKGIETAYDDASENGNANMEVNIARGTHPNLRSRLDEVDDKQQQTTAQLQQKVGGGKKAEPEDLSAATLGLVTGNGGPVNLLTIPQEDSVTLSKMNDSAFNWNGYRAYAKPRQPSVESLFFIEKIFDLTGAYESIIGNIVANHIDYDYRTDDQNVIGFSSRTFFNNSDILGDITGGVNIQTAIKTPTLGKEESYSIGSAYTIGQYKYAHVLVRVHLTDKTKFSEAYIKNLKLTLGDTPIPDTKPTVKLYAPDVSSKLEFVNSAGFNLATIKSVQGIANQVLQNVNMNRWSGKTVNFLGDSITFGVGSSTNAKRYSTLVANLLGMTEKNHGISGTRIAKQGDTVDAFSIRYTNMTYADLTVVFGGINDFYSGTAIMGAEDSTDVETFYGALNVLMNGLLTKFPTGEVLFITPIQSFYAGKSTDQNNTSSNANLKDYRDAILKRAEHYGIPVLDLYAMGGIDAAHNEVSRTTFTSDGLHPNDAGHERIANRLVGKLLAI